jgi:hypothetical protein
MKSGVSEYNEIRKKGGEMYDNGNHDKKQGSRKK